MAFWERWGDVGKHTRASDVDCERRASREPAMEFGNNKEQSMGLSEEFQIMSRVSDEVWERRTCRKRAMDLKRFITRVTEFEEAFVFRPWWYFARRYLQLTGLHLSGEERAGRR